MSVFCSWMTARRIWRKPRSPGATPLPGVEKVIVGPVAGQPATRPLSNLVQNALRFARAHVVVLLFSEDDELRLEVRDDGPGLGALSGRAAERGIRGASTAEQGFGLGLAIAEAAARRFGGRLELQDGEEGGAVVTIVLPRLDTRSELARR